VEIQYEHTRDVLTITLHDGKYAESDEAAPGVIVDYDADGKPLAIEILQAGRLVAPDGRLSVEIPLTVGVEQAAD
jgi:uncharacterized protein YuzE